MFSDRNQAYAILLGIAILLGGAGCSGGSVGSEADSSAQPARTFSEDEKVFNTAAMGYLQALEAADLSLAKVMAGASDGSSTLDTIHQALLDTRTVEDRLWSDFDGVATPGKLAGVRGDFTQCHELHQRMLQEYLGYWRDNDLGHLASGNELMHQAANMTRQCLDGLKTANGL